MRQEKEYLNQSAHERGNKNNIWQREEKISW